MLLDLIPVSTAFEPSAPIGADVYPDEQEAFVRGATAKARAMGYHITGQRIFVFVGYVREIGPQWVVLHAELGNPLYDTYHAKEIDRHVSLSEPAASSIWRIRGRGVIAVMQTHTMPDGNALVGYFALEK